MRDRSINGKKPAAVIMTETEKNLAALTDGEIWTVLCQRTDILKHVEEENPLMKIAAAAFREGFRLAVRFGTGGDVPRL